MIYIIKSSSYRLQKEKINKITDNIDNIVYYDMEEDDIKSILEEACYNDLFNSKKIIIVYNSYLFSDTHEYKNDIEILNKYIENENSNTTIIFLCEKFSLKKSIVKKIKNNNGLIDIKELKNDELSIKIKEYLKDNGFKIETNALNKLCEYQNSNYDYILNELDKIMIIKGDYVINCDDIEKYCTSNKEDSIFDFMDYLMNKNSKKVFEYLDKFKLEKSEPAIMLSTIAKQCRLIYAVKNLSKDMDEKSIAEYLGIHPYRVKLAKSESYNYSNSDLKNILYKIGELDEQIKTGLVDKYNGLKLLVVSLL